MAQQRPCWFLAPRGFPPDGSIGLGNVVKSPNSIDDPIYEADPLSLAEEKITVFEEREFSFTTAKSRRGRYGVFTSFLQSIVGLGVDAYGTCVNAAGREVQAASMTTSDFIPSKELLERFVKDVKIQDLVFRSRFQTRLYIVVGIMKASGASTSLTTLRERGGGISVGVDGAPLGVPVGSGPHGEMSQRSDVKIEVGSSDDFIFAYRLRQILVRKGAGVAQRVYNKGALFDSDKTASEREHQAVLEEEKARGIEVLGIDEEDVTGDDFGNEVHETDDGTDEGEESCCYVVPEGFD